MKKRPIPLLLAAIVLLLGATACHDEPQREPTICSLLNSPLRFTSAGVWSGYGTDGDLTVGEITFSHRCEEVDGETLVTGFVASRSSDNLYHEGEMYRYPYAYSAVTGMGVSGKNQPYLVAFVSPEETADTPFESRSARVWREGPDGERLRFLPYTMFVTNTSYAFYAMQMGIGEASRFSKGDWFMLTAHGLNEDGTETEMSVYLADFRSDNPEEWYINQHWENIDLTSLGIVTGVYFTLSSSDTGMWGMNTPSYFAIDKLSYFPED